MVFGNTLQHQFDNPNDKILIHCSWVLSIVEICLLVVFFSTLKYWIFQSKHIDVSHYTFAVSIKYEP